MDYDYEEDYNYGDEEAGGYDYDYGDNEAMEVEAPPDYENRGYSQEEYHHEVLQGVM